MNREIPINQRKEWFRETLYLEQRIINTNKRRLKIAKTEEKKQAILDRIEAVKVHENRWKIHLEALSSKGTL